MLYIKRAILLVALSLSFSNFGYAEVTGNHMIAYESYESHTAGDLLVNSGHIGLSPDLGTDWILSHVQPQLSPSVTDAIKYSGNKAQKSVRYSGSGQGVFTGFGTGVPIDVTKQYRFSCMFMAANDAYAANNCGQLFVSAGPTPAVQIVGSVYLNGYGNHQFGTWDNDGGGYVFSGYNPDPGKWYKLELVVSIGAFDSVHGVYPILYDSFVTDDLGVRTQLADDFAGWQNLTPGMVAWGWEINTGLDYNPNPETTNTAYFDDLTIAEVVSSDSLTWENKYECDTMPVPAGWTAAGGFEPLFTSQASGILKLDSLNAVDTWYGGAYTGKMYGWYTKSSGVDFAAGATMEIRAKLINGVAASSAYLRIADGDQYAAINFGADGANTTVQGYTVGALDQWHTIRVTVKVGEGSKWYLDGNSVPFYTESIQAVSESVLTLGDLTGSFGNDANWDIDYIRWTGAGVFAPPLPPVTSDSTSWENKYECDTMPVPAGWTAAGGFEPLFASQASGILKLDSLNAVDTWYGGAYTGKMYGWYTKSSGVDFAAGATMEIRAKLINGVSASSAYLRFADGDQYAEIGLVKDGTNLTVNSQLVGALDQWHTFRITAKEGQGVKVYLDGNSVPYYTEGMKLINESVVTFGDLTGSLGNESNWEIDYIRWTGAGAIAPAFCGDEFHPVVDGDLNTDCIVDFQDISVVAANWLLASSASSTVTLDSTTWEGRYEGDEYPDLVEPEANSWSNQADVIDISFLDNGVLNIDSFNLDKIGWFEKSIPVNFDDGFTLEIKAKLNASESVLNARSAAASLICYDTTNHFFILRLDDDQVSLGELGNILINPKDGYHTYRIAASTGTGMFKVWVDSNTTPSLTATLFEVGSLQNMVQFGDLTVTSDADWSIDYLRWTSQGAFGPAGAQGYCGDGNHKLREGDVNRDCSVNLADFSVIAQDWLLDNRPN